MAKYDRYFKDAVKVKGRICKCSPEVAACVNQGDWVENYQECKKRAPVKRKTVDGVNVEFDPLASSREYSLDLLITSGGEHYLGSVESFEDAVLDRLEKEEQMEIMDSIVSNLSEEEQKTYKGMKQEMSSREFEKKYGVPARTYSYRRAKLQEKFRKMIPEEQYRRAAARAEAYR